MRRPDAGFTLLEVLVVVVVLGFVIAMLEQGVSFGLRAMAMQAHASSRQTDLAVVDQSLRNLIRGADPGLFPEPATLRGTSTSMSMITALPASSGHERAAVVLFESGGQLCLRWTPLRHVEAFKPSPEPQQTVVLSGIASLHIDYFGGSGWTTSWNADHLPRLVQLTIGFSDVGRHWPPIIVAPVRDAVEQ